jgi:hypothetical protein
MMGRRCARTAQQSNFIEKWHDFMRRLHSRPWLELVICFLMFKLAVPAISDGWYLFETQGIIWEAEKNWRAGDFASTANLIARAVQTIVEGGSRRQISNAYSFQSHEFCRQGDLPQALESCKTAARILDRYDDEGALNYYCLEIENSINGQSSSSPCPWLFKTSGEP